MSESRGRSRRHRLALIIVMLAGACATSSTADAPATSSSPAQATEPTSTGVPPATAIPPVTTVAPPTPVPSVDPTSTPEPVPLAPVPADLFWERCPGGECTTITVPLDYDDPTGTSIEVAVARKKALDSENRIGALFVNFGGPGGESTEAFARSASALGTTFRRFDIVAWDPRGIGDTERLACDEVLGNEFPLIAIDPSDGFSDEVTEQEAEFADVAACALGSGAIIDHLGTVNVARDMNQVRLALGEDQLNYLGFSYGTQIGWVYATLFGGSVRAMVLDGAVPGGAIGADDFVAQLGAFQRTFDHFDAVCERTPACALGAEGMSEAVERIAEQLRENPVDLTGGEFGEAEFRSAILGAMYLPAPVIGPPLTSSIAAAGNGRLTGLDAIRTAGNGSSTPGAYQAVLCADGGDFPGPAGQEADYAASFASSTTFGMLGEVVRCDLWPGEVEELPIPDASSAPTILIIGNTFDPATPYEDAVLLKEQLAGSVLLTVEGTGHTAVLDDRCATDHAVRYFNEVVSPVEGSACFTSGVVGIIISDNGQGFRIDDVVADSAAAQAGVLAGDVILSIDGRTIAANGGTPTFRADVPLEWVLLRDGQETTLTITPKFRPWS